MKRLATVSTFTLVLVSCSAAAAYSHNNNNTYTSQTIGQAMPGSSLIQTVIANKNRQTYLEAQAAAALEAKIKRAEYSRALALNKRSLENRIIDLKQRIGKTYYVFSGSSASGWDCSGLVRWYYAGLGIDIPHSANKQGNMRPKVLDPLPGDIVVFKYKNSTTYHHSAIYLGNNKIVHAGFGSGDKTETLSLDSAAFKNNVIEFVRVLEN